MKRILDIVSSGAGLVLLSPFLLLALLLIWLQDFRSPLYLPPRVGKNGKTFTMVKLRSMVVGADKSKVDSTGKHDSRITPMGRIVRAYKLDEFFQLVNVFLGSMSLVGPRPNIKRETDIYTTEERGLLSVTPGITDLASIVFADEGDILAHSEDANIDYNQRIRPWKSRLGLLYVQHHNLSMDLRLIALTVLNMISRKAALQGVVQILDEIGADDLLKKVALREEPLFAYPPPGATEIVTSREPASVANLA